MILCSKICFTEGLNQSMTAMENENKNKIKRWGLAGYLIAGAIFTFSNKFKVTIFHDLMILAIAIYAGNRFYYLREKIKFTERKVVRNLLATIIILFLSALVIGFLTPILNLIVFHSRFKELLPLN